MSSAGFERHWRGARARTHEASTETSAAGAPLYQQPASLLLLDLTAKSVLFTWVFQHIRGSALLAALFHATTNLFVVSPAVADAEGMALPLLAAGAKWTLVGVVIAVAGPGLAKGPRPEALPEARWAPKSSVHPTS